MTGQASTGQNRSRQVKAGHDWSGRVGQVKSEHVLTQETKKLPGELAQENRIALLWAQKKKKNYLS